MSSLAEKYHEALAAYLQLPDEAALSRAYELGREALGQGSGVLDMAQIHQKALDSIPAGAPKAAGPFFQELLSPFEMALRGYRQANRELTRQKEAAEAANKELEAFSYSVSHDLRSPLRSIDGFSRALKEDFASKLDEQGMRYLNKVCAATKHMELLIDDMLALTRVSRKEMIPQVVDLSDLAGKILEDLRNWEPWRKLKVEIQGGLTAQGDPGLLRILLENLLGNAWKFSSKSAEPKIEFFSEPCPGEGTAFKIRDNGAGFDMTYAGKLFVVFQRLHGEDEFQGTGVGLATVLRVVNRHGGRIWAEGKVGQGATFSFTLGDASGLDRSSDA